MDTTGYVCPWGDDPCRDHAMAPDFRGLTNKGGAAPPQPREGSMASADQIKDALNELYEAVVTARDAYDNAQAELDKALALLRPAKGRPKKGVTVVKEHKRRVKVAEPAPAEQQAQ